MGSAFFRKEGSWPVGTDGRGGGAEDLVPEIDRDIECEPEAFLLPGRELGEEASAGFHSGVMRKGKGAGRVLSL
ncbi:hypothetical protein ASF71_20495 [Deinococcus sp. Leaf326]|nr:hypothetical protein ASF71_20495 [Deinococcus sp. Leaf326]